MIGHAAILNLQLADADHFVVSYQTDFF